MWSSGQGVRIAPPALSSGNVGRGVPWLNSSVQSATQWPKSLPSSAQSRTIPASPACHPAHCDLLFKKGPNAITEAVMTPPQACESQPLPVYVDFTRNELSPAVLQCLDIRPNTVILHVYDLNEDLTRANNVINFQIGMGGAFHVGTEVYGGEWVYGASGVSCDLPRACTGHAYKCSVIVGCTALQRHEVASELQSLMESWQGKDYDVFGHNCCSFATEFCASLGCEQIPPWVDRFPRLLHNGQMAGQGITYQAAQLGQGITNQASQLGQGITNQASQLAQQLPGKVKPHLDFAAHMHRQVVDASRAAMFKADQHAQDIMSMLKDTYHSVVQTPTAEDLETSEAEASYYDDLLPNSDATPLTHGETAAMQSTSTAFPQSTSCPQGTSLAAPSYVASTTTAPSYAAGTTTPDSNIFATGSMSVGSQWSSPYPNKTSAPAPYTAQSSGRASVDSGSVRAPAPLQLQSANAMSGTMDLYSARSGSQAGGNQILRAPAAQPQPLMSFTPSAPSYPSFASGNIPRIANSTIQSRG